MYNIHARGEKCMDGAAAAGFFQRSAARARTC